MRNTFIDKTLDIGLAGISNWDGYIMKLSTRTRYGLRATLELAENYGKGPLQLKTIAIHQNISVKYLEQMMAVLKAAGIVRSIRGPGGGYTLNKKPCEITVSDCFNCLEGPVVTTECVQDKKLCDHSADCITRRLWSQVQQAVVTVLQSVTLQSLIDEAKADKTINKNIY